LAIAAVGIGLLIGTGSASADSTFTPVTGVRMCNAMPAGFPDPQVAGNPSCAENLTSAAAADVTTTTTTFSPGGTAIAAGGSIPAGTKIGGVHELVTMGLANATCSTVTTRDVVLFNVALPDNTGNPSASTNLAYPQVPGTSDRFSKWKIGSPPGITDPSGIVPGIDASHAGGSSVAIQGYPKYLLDAFGGLVPQAVYGGLTKTQGEWAPLYLVQFNAGALSTLPGAYSLMNANMGQPVVWVSGDPTSTMPSVSNITSTCTPLTITTTLLGQDPTNTYTRATSPSGAATAYFLQYAASLRDLDQDGFENALDTCPLNPNVGSPKTGGGDANGNGIDAACDPNDNAPSNNDVDSDGFQNRQDNCPLVANPTQAESETLVQADLGPQYDNIGDACDTGTAGGVGTGADHCTGVAPAVQIKQNGQCISITLSPTVADGRYITKTNVIPKCIGGPDLDGDGYCSAQDSIETGACASASPPNFTVRHNA
jgi:hypothetical protein